MNDKKCSIVCILQNDAKVIMPPDPMRFLALMSLLNAMQADKKHENKDIRSSDFDSDEEFKKWFRGGDEE